MLHVRFARFALIGGLATAIQYALLILLVRGMAMNPTLASAIGFTISAATNYLGNYYYTFASGERHRDATVKFALLAGVGLVINSVLMQLLVASGVHYLRAQIAATVIVLIWNFVGNSIWTFRAGMGSPAGYAALLSRNRDLIAILALAAAIRAIVLLLSDNEPGDADARALNAVRWAQDPVLIRSGVWLPLHFYATGMLTWLFGSPIAAGKALSFVTGSLTVIPLFWIAERYFDRRTAVVTGLMFAVYGLHVELSAVVMSEAPCALLMVLGLYCFLQQIRSATPAWGGLLMAAVLLSLAGGFRQEPWLLTGILSGYLLLQPRLRRFAVPFGLVGLSSFILWDIANASVGEDDTHALFAVGRAKAHEALYYHFSATRNLLKWVWIFMKSPGPVIAGLAVYGWVLAFRRRLPAELAWIGLLLVAPFVALSVVKPEWAPQDRYTVFVGLLALPYAAAAAVAIFEKRRALQPAMVAIVVVSIATQSGIYLWKYGRPLPIPAYNANDVAVWKWLAAHADADTYLVVEDTEWRSPGLVAHSGRYDHPYRIVYSFRGPESLHEAIAGHSSSLLLVLHSPLSKWSFLDRLQPQLLFENGDYRILAVEAGLAQSLDAR